ncbi:hypothetical protein WA026_011332 [Henosepilachna vigintioctopunctata]|uniref:Uncharacterized protein n=1 Tax=Henosepilachna vigintioctopunctata TaxID=420089 RepID=A0AAW1U6C9_9CUCU
MILNDKFWETFIRNRDQANKCTASPQSDHKNRGVPLDVLVLLKRAFCVFFNKMDVFDFRRNDLVVLISTCVVVSTHDLSSSVEYLGIVLVITHGWHTQLSQRKNESAYSGSITRCRNHYFAFLCLVFGLQKCFQPFQL